MKKLQNNILISRCDSIGDVVLTLPVATILKKYYPDVKIGFMGKAYTKAVIEACGSVDEFIDVEDFLKNDITICGEKPEAVLHVFPVPAVAKRAKKQNIKWRIGTQNRLYHWFTCNTLVSLSRKNSLLHEAQLNLKLLQPLGIPDTYTLEEIGELFSLNKIHPLKSRFASLLPDDKYNLILHPKSQGNGREWGLENFIRLIDLLDKTIFRIFISGVKKERSLLDPIFTTFGDKVTDLTGKMNLAEFISFINQADGLVASGTGPLHLAAALGKDALGVYPPIRPVHPQRWAPLGKKAKVFVLNKNCSDCKGNKQLCHCIQEINPLWIKEHLEKAAVKKLFRSATT